MRFFLRGIIERTVTGTFGPVRIPAHERRAKINHGAALAGRIANCVGHFGEGRTTPEPDRGDLG